MSFLSILKIIFDHPCYPIAVQPCDIRDIRWGEHRAAEIRGGQLCPTESAASRAEGAAPDHQMDGWSWKIRKFKGTTMKDFQIIQSLDHRYCRCCRYWTPLKCDPPSSETHRNPMFFVLWVLIFIRYYDGYVDNHHEPAILRCQHVSTMVFTCHPGDATEDDATWSAVQQASWTMELCIHKKRPSCRYVIYVFHCK